MSRVFVPDNPPERQDSNIYPQVVLILDGIGHRAFLIPRRKSGK